MAEQTIKLTYTDGSEAEVVIKSMPVRNFPRGLALAGDNFDELRLIDLAFNQPEGWSLRLTPESYSKAAEAMYAVCADFFGCVARRRGWQQAMALKTTS